MKFAIFGVLLAIFALAEYAYVEVIPLPPQERMAKFARLPFVKPIAEPILELIEVHQLEKLVDEGHPVAYNDLYHHGREKGDEAMMERGKELLRSSDTHFADYVLYVIENGPGQAPFREWEEERMVLFLRMLKENLRRPGIDDEAHERVSKGNIGFVKTFYLNAESGDERSQRIVDALDRL